MSNSFEMSPLYKPMGGLDVYVGWMRGMFVCDNLFSAINFTLDEFTINHVTTHNLFIIVISTLDFTFAITLSSSGALLNLANMKWTSFCYALIFCKIDESQIFDGYLKVRESLYT